MIKAVIFELDAVLVDADRWHRSALNVALEHADVEPVSWHEYLTVYKGLPTRAKLELLTERKGLPRGLWPAVHASMQEVTEQIVAKLCTPDLEKVEMMRLLSRDFRIAVCASTARSTLQNVLTRAGLMPFVELHVSNQDVERPTPSPDIHLQAFARLGLSPGECVIVGDSDVGKAAALASGGVLCSVDDAADVNYYRILRTVREAERVNVVIPAAGRGRRFAEAGYQHPKPLLDVEGRPMIARVLENLRGVGRPVVVMQQRHIERYAADWHVRDVAHAAEIVGVDVVTEGPACSVLRAAHHIDNANELVVAGCDQYVDADVAAFVQRMRDRGADAGILTFRDERPTCPHVRTDAGGRVLEVAENAVISDQAATGIYYFRTGAAFVAAATRMIASDIRVDGELCLAPVLNEMIADGAVAQVDEIRREQMHSLDTPAELEAFLALRARTTLRLAA